MRFLLALFAVALVLLMVPALSSGASGQDNWARDSHAAASVQDAAVGVTPLAAPLTDPATPWALYIGVALVNGTFLVLALHSVRHMPRDA
jgi:hypothetical protein